MKRIVIFGEPTSLITTILLRATMQILSQRDDFQIVALCDTGRKARSSRIHRAGSLLIKTAVKRLFDQDYSVQLRQLRLFDMYRLAKRFGIPVVVPPQRNINHPDFVAYLKQELKPSVALSYICLQIFSKALLDSFETAVNYHNALLPKYGGLMATAWSVYHNEPTTGFTFHHMNKQIDRGAILLQGSVPIESGLSLAALERRKTVQAVQVLPQLFDLIHERNPGVEQSGRSSYFGRRELLAVRNVEEPSTLTWADLRRRMRSFGHLYLRLHGETYKVTKLEQSDGKNFSGPSFTTADGVVVSVCRVTFLPWPLYRMRQRLDLRKR